MAPQKSAVTLKRAAIAERNAYDENVPAAGSVVPSYFYVFAVLNTRLEAGGVQCG